jgi:hypothetical protein
VRLTNWDALSLLGVIDDDATVEFKWFYDKSDWLNP